MTDYKETIEEARNHVERFPIREGDAHRVTRLADAIEALVVDKRYWIRERLSLVSRAVAAEAERDVLRAQLEGVRRYAEDREAYGRRGRTVGSARIASDLFRILDVERTLAELAERQERPDGLEGVL